MHDQPRVYCRIRDGWLMLRCVWKLQRSITGYRSGRQTQGRVPVQSACASMAALIAISQHLCMLCRWASVVAQIGKESACNGGDPGSILGSGRSSGEGNGNQLQYFSLGNPLDRGAWWATVHGVAKSQTRLSDFQFQI